MNARFDTWAVKAIAKHGHKFDLSLARTEFDTVRSVVTIVCPDHGSFTKPAYQHLSQKYSCPQCADEAKGNGVRLTHDEILARFKEVHGSTYDYSKVKFKTTLDAVTIICPTHGEFQQKPHYHQAGHGCPKCGYLHSGDDRRRSLEEAIHLAYTATGKTLDFSKNIEYSGNQYDYAVYTCPKHGEKKAMWYSLWAGHGCPGCVSGAQRSRYERWLEGIYGDTFKYHRDVTVLGGRRTLDAYSEKHRLAIEINGVYWHSEKHQPRQYHVGKTSECRDKGIQLLHFWDYEIDENPALVLSMIDHKLGRSHRVFARKLEVCEVDKAEAKAFFDQHHLQGSVGCQVAYGLRSKRNGKLAAVMSFGQPRFNRNFDMELIRFACHTGLHVVGGASKLFTAFVRNHPNASVVSYADIRYSYGNLYRQLGFDFVRRTPPNYMYTQGNGAVSRYQAQKHKLSALLGDQFDPNLSEAENMKLAGYFKVFDCGNLVYSFHQPLGVTK